MIGEMSALGCALCWAVSSTLTKSLVRKFEPLSLNFIRCLGAAVLFIILILLFPGRNALWQAPPEALGYLALSALFGIFIGDALYLRALRLIKITLALPLAQAAMPILTLMAAALFLGETLSWSLILGTALVISGIYFIAVPGGRRTLLLSPPRSEKKGRGIIFILTAALFWALSISFLKLGLHQVGLILANGVRLPIAALFFFILLLFTQSSSKIPEPRARNIFLGALTGILSFGLGGLLFLFAIQQAGAGKAAVLTTSSPLFGLPLSALFLEESLTPRVILGTSLVVLGIVFILPS